PAVTRRAHGDGSAWYLATQPSPETLGAVLDALIADAGVRPELDEVPEGVEVARRGDLVTIINHGTEPVRVEAEGTLLGSDEPFGARTLAPQEFAFVLAPREPAPARADLPLEARA